MRHAAPCANDGTRKAWKTQTQGFPTFPRSLEIRKPGFPHSHTHDGDSSHQEWKNRMSGRVVVTPSDIYHAVRFLAEATRFMKLVASPPPLVRLPVLGQEAGAVDPSPPDLQLLHSTFLI